jgi:alpha-L-arabinofuranosidase
MLPLSNTPKIAIQALLLIVLQAGTAHGQAIHATIDASRPNAPISKYIYGQFIEHIGGIINRGLWAEMLDDRKFYYPVKATTETAAAPQGPRALLRRWQPIGPEDSIVMDTRIPYTGPHTPLVTLKGNEARGVQQSGLAVRKGKAYAGRVVLAGDPGARVTVALVWGSGANDRQTIVVGRLATAYAKHPLKFSAQADSDDARLEIAGTGTGAFHIGAVSLMPADNLNGFRAEVIATLKGLRSGVYRFPGGNFVSAHEWREAIGDPDRRPPVMDPVWKAVQPNDVGTDEFMTMCRLLGVEPYITVNAGFGDAWSAAQYVEYTNGPATTPMGRLRAANGHPEPYNVKFWGIGNEMWGSWQFGYMPLDQFIVKHRMFARAMRQVDPTIKLIASGATPDAMTGSGEAKKLTGRIVAEYGSAADWSGAMLSQCLDDMDLLSEHYYVYNGTRYDLEKGAQVPVDPGEPLADWARRAANLVRAKYEHYQEYLARIPGLKARPVPIALDEWAYAGVPPNSYKVVPAYAWALHEMFRHSDLYQLGGFTFATSLVSSNRTDAVLNPAGLLFKVYREHFGTIPVGVSGSVPQPMPKYPPGGDQPRVNPGSDTYPLDVVAALGDGKKMLHVAVLNPSDAPQELQLTFQGMEFAGKGRLWRMAPPNINATITVGQKPGVEIEEQALDAVPRLVSVPPYSVSIYELPAK